MSLRFVATPFGSPAGDVAAAWRATGGRAFPGAARDALLARGAAATRSLERLLAGARAVTTGQQAGLFTGPLYTVYKAVTAAALAEALEVQFGESVVPVFWVAGDDHDFAEVNHCEVLGADGRPHRCVLRERGPDAPMLPAFREPVGAEGASALAQLESWLPPGDFRAETMSWLAGAYRPETSLAEAHALALAELVGPLGVVVAKGWDAALKSEARPVLLAAVREAPALDVELAKETARLRAAGAETPVEVGQGLSLLMLEGRLGRDRLRPAADGRFTLRRSGETVSLDDLARIASEHPDLLSGNVLLRPAVEAALFPSVAYVGGPVELAYLAQAVPVFTRVRLPQPARVPRLSGLLVEGRVDRVLEKYALPPAELGRPEGELGSRLARSDLPPSAAAALEAAREAIRQRYAALAGEAAALDKTLERTVEGARNQALVGVNEIEKKLVSALKRGGETALQQLSRARDQLFPNGQPQERAYSVVSFLARHGRAALDPVVAAAREHARAILEAPSGPV